jgi:hypothetical protein
MATVAYVGKPAFEMSHLRDQGVDEVRYLTDGFTKELGEVQRIIQNTLKDFDPAADVVVPVGSSVHNLMIGFLLGQQYTSLRLLVYSNGQYLAHHFDADAALTYAEGNFLG